MNKNYFDITRWHEIDAGHRVVGQGGKCTRLHGHRYRIHFIISNEVLNDIGMVLDFGIIKEKLCAWLDLNWDHRLLIWEEDPMLPALRAVDPQGVVSVPFNPTAENMADFLLRVTGPQLLEDEPCRLVAVTVEETSKCAATVTAQ